ncbi:MAG: HAD family hydrolase [Dehalococcoidia bacterium SM23_28_2]|nr:MAG: HAD family hydrolase [Dehalococcoidia bacterium SM23_28_2]
METVAAERSTMNREDAWALLCEYTQNPGLRKHALAVEAAMRAYARRFGEDEEKWATVGLLHDFDYEIHPTLDKHPQEGAKILRERGYSEDIVYAVLSHAEHLGLERKTLMDKAVYAVDELTGLITAVALVKPSKSLGEVDARSVRKKMKDKAFARSVNRDDIVKGAEILGMDLDEHIAFVIEAMKEVADELVLRDLGPLLAYRLERL